MTCEYDSTCIIGQGNAYCKCHLNGQVCSTNAPECLRNKTICIPNALSRKKRDVTCNPNPCLNNGVCSIVGTNYQCQCTSGFTGTNCDIDINECLNNPCALATSCKNTFGSYICTCVSGFQGVNCDVKINTCSPSPCQNTAQCYDMVNDYDCLSSLTINMFGGKNSNIPLTGCSSSTTCQSSQQCIPTYNGVQSFYCACNPGLTGSGCTTNVTYTLQSGMNYKKDISGYQDVNISFALRSTSPKGLLTVLVLSNEFFVGIDVYNHGIRAVTATGTTLLIPYGSVTTDPSQYIPYRILMLVRTISGVNVFCVYVRIGSLPQGYYCSVIPSNSLIGTLYFNKHDDFETNPNLKAVLSPIPNMEGCIIDYAVNATYDFLTSYGAGSSCLGPLKTCSPTSCSLNLNKGDQCIPYWLSKVCICKRPFFGTNCENEIRNLTLSSGSFMQLQYPLEFVQSLKNNFQFSLFLLTSNTNGILFYIGSFNDLTNPNNNVFLSGEIISGYINIKSKLNGSTTVENLTFGSSLSWKINDGLFRLIFISLLNNKVTVTLTQYGSSRNVIALTLSNTMPFSSSFSSPLLAILPEINIVAFGLSPTSPFSSFESLMSPFIEIMPANLVSITVSSTLPPLAFSSTPVSLNGVVQDIEWNGFRTNVASQSGLPATSLVPINSQSLTIANVNLMSLCNPNPCRNGASCTVQNYNQIVCSCSSLYFGNFCQYNNLCSSSPNCSSSTTCIPRSDGYDCSKIISLTNNNQSIVLSVTSPLTTFTSITLKLRTRSVYTSLVRLSSKSLVVSLEIDNLGRLFGRYISSSTSSYPGPVVSTQIISDAVWHTISFLFSPYMQITVDESINRAADYGIISTLPVSSIATVTLGDAQNSFLGCVDQPLVGQYLITTNETTSFNSSLVNTTFIAPVISGCSGMDMCSQGICKNNATCIDTFNKWTCNCTNKFDGTTCIIPTCLSLSPCSNNSLGACSQLCPGNNSCGVNEIRYGCQCISGWIGSTCNIVNPCIVGANTNYLSPLTLPSVSVNPCQNNGNCTFLVNDSTKSSTFTCQCLSPWSGNICQFQTLQSGVVAAGIVVFIIVCLLIIGLIIWIAKVHQSQKESGTYHPEESINNSLEAPVILQKPPAEKII